MLRLPASHPAALRFLRLAVPRSHLLFAPCDSRCQSHWPGAFEPSPGIPQIALHTVEKTGPPKFLRDPNDLFAHALRLRRNRHATRHDRRGGLAPAKGTTRASTRGLSKLNHIASRLAVYASQCGLPRTPRKTRFRPLAGRYRVGFSPTGSPRKVSATHSCSHPPFAGLTWRDPVFFPGTSGDSGQASAPARVGVGALDRRREALYAKSP